MSKACRLRDQSRSVHALLVIAMAFAVLLMHSVMVHARECGPGGHPAHQQSAVESESASAGAMPDLVTSVRESSKHVVHQQVSAGSDCDMHSHPCVFVRADAPLLLFVVLALFWWGFPTIRRAVGRWCSRIVELGRPPPWAQPTHLDLRVIRC